jgi:putative endonuclease
VAGAASERRRRIGRRGEEVVADWYRARDFEVVDRNWRCSGGELDLVLVGAAGELVVFCEVKSRTSGAFGSPLEAVTKAKARRLRRLAGRWMAEARPPGLTPRQLRLDVAVVSPGPSGRPVVEVVEGAC